MGYQQPRPYHTPRRCGFWSVALQIHCRIASRAPTALVIAVGLVALLDSAEHLTAQALEGRHGGRCRQQLRIVCRLRLIRVVENDAISKEGVSDGREILVEEAQVLSCFKLDEFAERPKPERRHAEG